MSSVYAKRGQLYFSVKVAGQWRVVRSPYKVGQERTARVVVKRLQERLAVTRAVERLPSTPCVYLVQMMPAGAPLILKVGFSTDLRARLKTYRCLCPEAQVIAVRPGSPAVERNVLLRYERAFRKIGTEVFEVVDVKEAISTFETAGWPE